jgi:hypothetical protein
VDFAPKAVMAGAKSLRLRSDLDGPGYTFDAATGVLRIRHDDAQDIDIQGEGGHAPVELVTFDDPHEAAGTVLKGEYPAGVIDWGEGAWKIGVPAGGFGTFNLELSDARASSAGFRFYWPRVFAGIDVYNDGASEAVVTVRSPQMPEVSFTVKPGQTRRVRTEWRDASSKVIFEFKNGEGLRFDNLAWRRE